MVLKTGPDRPDQPIRPVQPSTGELSGSVRFNEPFVVKPALNWSNRRLNRRTGRTVRFFTYRWSSFFQVPRPYPKIKLKLYMGHAPTEAQIAATFYFKMTLQLGPCFRAMLPGHASRPSLLACWDRRQVGSYL